MRVAVGVASIGRPNEIGQLLTRLTSQTLQPSAIVLSVEKASDCPEHVPPSVQIITGPRGLCLQRNRCIDRLSDLSDVIVFFDDDYLPARDSLSAIAAYFQSHPDVVGATGRVLADGILRGSIPYEEATAVVAAYETKGSHPRSADRNVRALYGCNMAIRTAAVPGLRFDESLPFYGWLEDVDFAARLMKKGRVVATGAFAGVHRGVTSGRISGVRLGYSQMMNPVYLLRKRTMGRRHAVTMMCKNFIANHAKAFRPEPWIDRTGRRRGNWLAIRDIVRGRIDPTTILRL